MPRILLVRLSAIGDVVRVLPALHSLRDGFPHAQIDWAVERKAADIVSGHPELDQVLVFERPRGRMNSLKAFLKFCRSIRAGRYDVVVDFHGILKSGFIAGFSGAPDRYGFARPRSQEGSHLFFNRKLSLGSDVLNRIEENLRLAEQLAPRRDSLNVSLFVPEEVQIEVEEYFEETFDAGKLVVAMHVPIERPEKQWPTEHFAALSDLLQADGRFEVLLTWGPGQYDYIREVAAKAKRSPDVAPDMPGLKHYMWLIHCADLYFGGDTGPMHIASAMDTPVVAVFGGTDARRHAPFRKPYEVLRAEDFVEDKSRLASLHDSEKLRLITPEAAYDACVRIIASRRINVS